MEISPRELRDVEIRESLRGYNRDEVNDLLERAAGTIEATTERLQQLTERLASAQSEAGRTRETSAPGTRPEPSEVAMPGQQDGAHRDTPTSTPQPAPAPAAAPSPAPGESPAAPDKNVAASASPSPERGGGNAATHEVDVRTLFEQSKNATITPQGQTQQAAAGPDAGTPAPPEQSAERQVPRPPQQGAPGPVDLLGNDGRDADVLDDDAFFATLRDAVHDDAPLGPRDENDPTGDQSFFDQDADRGTFRDVFRRRR